MFVHIQKGQVDFSLTEIVCCTYRYRIRLLRQSAKQHSLPSLVSKTSCGQDVTGMNSVQIFTGMYLVIGADDLLFCWYVIYIVVYIIADVEEHYLTQPVIYLTT